MLFRNNLLSTTKIIPLLSAIVFVIFLPNVASQKPSTPANCTHERLVYMDEVSAQSLAFWSDRRLPTNKDEFAEFCRKNRRLEAELRDYAKNCAKGEAKLLIMATIYSAARADKQVCKSQRLSAETIETAPCLNGSKKKLKRCMKELIRSIYDGVNATGKDKLPITCCSYYTLKDCTIKALSDSGPSVCSAKHIGMIEDKFDKIALETLRTVCGEYSDDSDKCDQLMKRVKKLKTKSKWKSPMVPVIDLLSSIQ